jgi:hypothetical protein
MNMCSTGRYQIQEIKRLNSEARCCIKGLTNINKKLCLFSIKQISFLNFINLIHECVSLVELCEFGTFACLPTHAHIICVCINFESAEGNFLAAHVESEKDGRAAASCARADARWHQARDALGAKYENELGCSC